METERRWKEIIGLAAPVVISKISFTVMGLVDTAMVGRLGASEQGAVGIATTYMFTLYVFGLGLVGVVNTIVSQHHGAGQPEMCGRALGQGLRLATGIGAITGIALLASEPLFALVGLSEEVSTKGFSYMSYRIIGLPGVFWYWAYNGYLEGLGKTRTAMWISLAANVVNIVLDYALIFGIGPIPAMGVRGAGLATAASNTFMLVCFVYVVHRKNSPFKGFGANRIWARTDWRMMGRMVRIGLPMGAQSFMEIGAFLVFSVIIGWVGDTELAANQVAIRLMSVSFMTAWGISVAATTLVGRHQGEQRSDLASEAVMRALVLVLGYTAICGVLFVTIPGQLTALFTPFSSVAGLAKSILLLVAITQVFDGISMVSYGALRGAGDTKWPLWTVTALNWGFGVPVVYVLTIPAGLGLVGAWVGIFAMLTLQAVLMFYRFRSGKWKAIQVVHQN